MPFEFISSASAVARQQQLWGIVIGSAGLGILGFSLLRDKGLVLSLIGLALLAVGGYYGYQSWQLKQTGGEWRITADEQRLDWRSPNQSVDPSFQIELRDIAFIDRGSRSKASDERARFHLVLNGEGVIALRDISGVDLEALVRHLKSQGIEVRETGRFYEPVELRNK